MSAAPTILVQPPPRAWPRLLPSPDPLARDTRRALGLPADVPVILSGHQAAFWHAGILAKLDALAAAAEARRAAPAWLVVDQDHHDFAHLRVPVRTGRPAPDDLAEARWTLAPRAVTDRLGPDTPAAALPAFEPEPVPPEVLSAAATPAVRAGLVSMREALAGHARAASAPEQVAAAAAQLAGHAGIPRFPATRLARTPGLMFLVEHLRADPQAAARAYNAAAAAHPAARLAPLHIAAGPAETEVPLWVIRPGTARRERATAADLASVPPEHLAPRALLQTAWARLFACDLFIHGTGGAGVDGRGGYDAATAAWVRAWLGRELAPVATVSATVLLPLTDRAPVTPEQVRRAEWLAHRVRHDPALLAEPGAALMKRSLGALAADPRRPHAERVALFRRLREVLGEVSRFNAQRVTGFADKAAGLRRQSGLDRLAADRTWPFPFLESGDRLALRRVIATAFGAAG